MSNATREALKRRHLRWIQPHEERYAREYRALMEDLREQVRKTGDEPFNLDKWQDKAVKTMAPVYRETIRAAGRDFLTKTLSIRAKLAAGVLTKAARDRSNDLVVSLEAQFADRLRETIKTTYDALASVIDEAATDKLDADEINDLIDEEWDDILGPRTDAIALTETNGAVNSVRDYLMQELVELQTWVTAGDERVRATHAIYGEAGAKPVGFDWATLIPDTGYTLRYPCDPECHEPAEVVNCRCFTVPAGEVELTGQDLKDYLDDFDMDPEDVMLSEDQTKAWAVKGWEDQPRDENGRWSSGGSYPVAGDVVGGMRVRGGPVQNTESISASTENATVLPGIRVVQMDDVRPEGGWGGFRGFGYAAADDNRKVERLIDAMKESGEVSPLIVVVGADGPYVLEGGHRVAALAALGVKEFPAMVAVESKTKAWEDQPRNPDGTWGSGGGLSAGAGAARAGRDRRVDGDGAHLVDGGYYESQDFGRREPDRVYPYRVEEAPEGEQWDAAHRRLLRNEIAREITGKDPYNRVVREDGRMFATGHPVEFVYAHNRTPAPKPGPNDTFQQTIEPSGMYITHIGSRGAAHARSLGLEVGRMRFQRPLVIAESMGDRLYGEDSWKAELSRRNDGKTGRALTRALVAQGYDGIVTVGRHGLGEIVALPGAEKKTTGSGITKEFDPNQPRDESGRWVDIFGSSQPSESAPDVNTHDPAAPDYAVDSQDVSATPPQHPTMSSDEMNRRTDEVAARRDALKAQMQEEAKAAIAQANAEVKKLDEDNAGLKARIEAARVTTDEGKAALKTALEAALVKDREEYAALKAASEKITGIEFKDRSPEQADEMERIGERFNALDKKWGGDIDQGEMAITRVINGVEYDGKNALSGEYGTVKLDPNENPEAFAAVQKVADGHDAGVKLRDEALAYNNARARAEQTAQANERLLQSDELANKAERQAIAEQGVDYAHARMVNDTRFYEEIHEETADAWKHIGGRGPITLRFAAEEAFGLEHGIAYDSKLGRAVTDLDADYPGASQDVTLWAAALRREYDETQKEISEGVEFTLAGENDGEIDYDALSEMESEAWSNLDDSDKANYLTSKTSAKATEYGYDHMDEVEELANQNNPDGKPELIHYATVEEVKDNIGDESGIPAALAAAKSLNGGKDEDSDNDFDQVTKKLENLQHNPFSTQAIGYDVASALELLSQGATSYRGMSSEEITRKATEVVARITDPNDRSSVASKAAAALAGDEAEPGFFKNDNQDDRQVIENGLARLREAQDAYMEKAKAGFKTVNDQLAAYQEVTKASWPVTYAVRNWAGAALADVYGSSGKLSQSDIANEDGYVEAHDEWISDYVQIPYIQADPDGSIYEHFVEQYEPDDYPRLESEKKDITINPEDWPLTLHRTATVSDKATYIPNFIESWAYDVQHFGRDHFEEKVDPARVLVFQGAKNWTTPKGQQSMGMTENEFILLPEVPKYVRDARARYDAVRSRADALASKNEQRARALKIDALMVQYRELQRLQDFGTRDQHNALRDQIEAQLGSSDLTWDDLIRQAAKEKP